MTKDQVLVSLEEVIAALGTYDITTIRASMGMYLVCKAIHETTDIKVLLTGEISDELFGYKYTDFAPNAEEFQKEAGKRMMMMCSVPTDVWLPTGGRPVYQSGTWTLQEMSCALTLPRR